MEIDFSRSPRQPFSHQRHGVRELVKLNDPEQGRHYEGCFALFDDMGAGKTKQTIDAAQVLFDKGEINRVIVVAPGSVRPVWADPELGELTKHIWDGMRFKVTEFHAKIKRWEIGPKDAKPLEWFITNYEFIRSRNRLEQLLSATGHETFLVLDESSAVKNYRALQTKSCLVLRRRCGRVVLLNGTPIGNNPGDMFSQGNIMDPRILGCKSYFHFRTRYAVLGGYQLRQIVGWRDLDDLQRRFAPYVLRRLKTDCLDLPAKLPSVTITCALTPETWAVYKEMRDEMVTWLDQQTVSVASQAMVKAIRLAQITSGFIGGLQDPGIEFQLDLEEEHLLDEPGRPEWMPLPGEQLPRAKPRHIFHNEGSPKDPQAIGREKLDVFLEWYDQQLEADPNMKLLVWCRFRPELNRMLEVLGQRPGLEVGSIWGGQTKADRSRALHLLAPETAPKGPVVVVGTPASGSMGLNLAAAHTVVYMSNDYSLKTRLQSEDRVHRPGQVHAVSYFDVIATGPDGQKTVDHSIIKALRNKEDVANWTTQAWRKALME